MQRNQQSNTDVIGPIVGAGASIINTAIDSRTAKRNTDKTIKANKEMAEYQFTKDIEMWNMQNQYNDPSQQMARLKGAGLNPAQIYGKGASAGNVAGEQPKYNAPKIDYNYKSPINPALAIGMYQDYQLKQAQIDNVNAQRRVTEQDNIIKEAEAGSAYDYFQNRAAREGTKWETEAMETARQRTEYDTIFQKAHAAGQPWFKPRNKTEYENYVRSKYQQPVQQLSKTNAEIANLQADNELKQLQLRFGQWLPYAQIAAPLIGKMIPGGIFAKGASKTLPKKPLVKWTP